jgi:hypothetical protein
MYHFIFPKFEVSSEIFIFQTQIYNGQIFLKKKRHNHHRENNILVRGDSDPGKRKLIENYHPNRSDLRTKRVKGNVKILAT